MKNPRYENMVKRMREYHRTHQWRLFKNGLYIPHSYEDKGSDSLSYWGDVGFILNGRRFIVWWQHPRHIYMDAIQDRAMDEAGPGPQGDWLFNGSTKNYKKVGKSGRRKKIVSYTSKGPSEPQKLHYKNLRAIENRLTHEGIDLSIAPSWKWMRLNWAMGVSLVAPMEVRNTQDVAKLAQLARSLVLQQTSLAEQFPNQVYDKTDWLHDQAVLAAQGEASQQKDPLA